MKIVLINKVNYESFKTVLPLNKLPDRNRYTLGAYNDEGVVAGAISFYLAKDRYEIDWLYVAPSMRRRGTATILLNQIYLFIRDTAEVYHIHARYEVTEKDLSLYGFFLSRTEMDTSFSHDRYYVSPQILKSVFGHRESLVKGVEDKQFFSLQSGLQNTYLLELAKENGYLIQDRAGWKSRCIPGLCRVISRNDKLFSAIFIMNREDGNLVLSYLYSNNPESTGVIISRVGADLIEKYPGSKLVFDAVGERAKPMANKLFPDAKKVCIYESVW